MLYPAIRLICLVVFGCTTLSSYAQETTTYSRPQVAIPDPVYVLNSTVIINGLLGEINPQEITAIEVYKGPAESGAQSIAPHLQNLSTAGVLNITSPKRIRSRSFAQVAHRLGLRGPLTFALNGHTLDAQTVVTLRIAPAAIGQIHILQPTLETPGTRVDIWLVPPPKPDYSRYPPGTIFIR